MLSLPIITAPNLRPEARLLAATLARLSAAGVGRVALWGAGEHTQKCLPALTDSPVRLVCIIDDNAREPDQFLAERPVVRPESARKLAIDAVVCSSDQWEDAMWQRRALFTDHGIPVHRLYPPRYSRRMTAIIEIAGICNARCTYCPTGNGEKSATRFMPVELFRDILTHLHRLNLIKSPVMPYSYGEPFLHPEINDILAIVSDLGYHARVSTNLLRMPTLTRASFETLSLIEVSLSGMIQSSYSRGHGGRLDRVLANIDRLLAERDAFAASCPIRMRWHRYRFNEDELESARAFCDERGMEFLPYFAHPNDLIRVADYFRGELPAPRQAELRRDLFVPHMEYVTDLFARAEMSDCTQFHDITIDEEGWLLPCCAVHNQVPGTRLGRVLDMDANALQRAKRSWDFCSTCISSGWAGFVNADLQPADLGLSDDEFGARGIGESDAAVDERFARLAERLESIPPRSRVAVRGLDSFTRANFGRLLNTIGRRHRFIGFIDDGESTDGALNGFAVVSHRAWRDLRPDAVVQMPGAALDQTDPPAPIGTAQPFLVAFDAETA